MGCPLRPDVWSLANYRLGTRRVLAKRCSAIGQLSFD